MAIEKLNLTFQDEQGTDFNKYGLIENGGSEKQVTLRRLAKITRAGTPLSAENLNKPVIKINEVIDKINDKVDNAINADNVTSLINNDNSNNGVVSFTIGNKTFSKTIVSVNFATNSNIARKLAYTRKIELSGDVTGQISFDGSQDVTMQTTLVNKPDLSNYYNKSEIDDFIDGLENRLDELGFKTASVTTTSGFDSVSVNSLKKQGKYVIFNLKIGSEIGIVSQSGMTAILDIYFNFRIPSSFCPKESVTGIIKMNIEGDTDIFYYSDITIPSNGYVDFRYQFDTFVHYAGYLMEVEFLNVGWETK